jgi:hypothetical protein
MENALTFIVSAICFAIWGLIDYHQAKKVYEQSFIASKETDFFVEQINLQSSLDETIEVFQFSLIHHQIWEGKIPTRIFKYHITRLVEAYKSKIDQFTPINLN